MATIYEIRAGDECYIGSTIRKASYRFNDHVYRYKKGHNFCSSYNLFEKHGITNCTFNILEEVPLEQRFQKEREYIEKNNTVNKATPYISAEEKINYYKKRYMDNKERLLTLEDCSCGRSYSIIHKLRHLQSAFHKLHV
jgi:hypothetical protein